MLKVLRSAIVVALVASQSTSALAEPIAKKQREDREPEAATGLTHKETVYAEKFMVASANPYASQAGYNILAKGGSAVDATIAVQLVLSLVEPQSSGIGGGAFFLYWDEDKKQLTTFDGRETAPKAATPDMFMLESGKPMRWIDAVIGGRSVGVPGVMHALYNAHQKHGTLPWKALFEDAIKLAENGFVVSPRLEKLVGMRMNPGIERMPAIKAYFFPNGEPVKAGDVIVNKKVAKVYRSLANEGIEPFYNGWIAKAIVDGVQNAAISPGRLTLEDMKNYRSIERAPVCGPYREYKLCGMGAPSSGGIAVIQILSQLQKFDLSALDPSGAEAIHLMAQSSRLAFADRDRYLADPEFVDVPTQGLLAPKYLAKRSELINIEKDMGRAQAGQPAGAFAMAENESYNLPSTSHISVVDADGNAVSMTTSVEMGFGSTLMVEGFILNNQLTDFSLRPSKNGQLIANRVDSNKRPRSSMAPMMVFDQAGGLKLVVGSPGGSRIINYVTKTMMGILDWKLTPQEAISLPNMTNRNGETTLERGTKLASLKAELEAKGHKVGIRDLNSGIQAIEITEKGMIGGADPRREGEVLGQ